MREFFQTRARLVQKIALWILPVLTGAVLASIDGKRNWLGGFSAYSLLLLSSTFLIEFLCRRLAVKRRVTWLGHSVFWLRLVIAVAMMGLMPVLGYQDSVVSQTGYVFQDAYTRDQQAWILSTSTLAISSAFSGAYSGDQYGGMLALSAMTYRFLSPNYHRPLLVLIWVALSGALSTVLLWRFTTDWLGNSTAENMRVARAAVLIFAFYPEAVLLGSSHMREAIVMLGITLLMQGYSQLMRADLRWLLWFFSGGIILLVFQVPIAVVTLIVLLGLFLLEPGKRRDWRVISLFIFLILVTITGSFLVFAELPSLSGSSPVDIFQTWLARNFNFQAHISERSSGMLQKLLDSGGERFTIPIVIGYGALQPVLPAALVDPAAAIWRIINILRAAGWYLLAPTLFYAAISVVRPNFQMRRMQRLWLSLACFGWIILAAANAGGDQWDNPRYRLLFLPWMAVLGAWVWNWALQQRDPWLKRFLFVSGLFTLFFLQWYLSRYITGLFHLDIRIMILVTMSAIVIYLLSCLIRDLRERGSVE